MGKVAKPLTIVVFPPLDEWPEIEKLEKQGHVIVKLTENSCFGESGDFLIDGAKYWVNLTRLTEADIIIGPRCWYLTELHRKHLTQAIKQARLRRYGTITKKRKKGDDDEKDDIPSSDPESTGC